MPVMFIASAAAVSAFFALMARRFESHTTTQALPKAEKSPLVSIIIPTYNSEASIGKTLELVQRSDYPRKEVIVVNDSEDRTPEIAKQYGANVIQNQKRNGKGYALNLGNKHAKGELLLFLDSDTELEKNTISTLIQSLYYHKGRDTATAAVVPKYTCCNQNVLPAKMSHLEQQTHQTMIKAQMNLGSILSIRGSCVLMQKDIFEETGGFSPTLLEDGDFTAKLHKLGYRIKYEPHANVGIHEPESIGEFLRAKKRYGKGTLFCAMRHKGVYLASRHAALSFYPWFFVLGLLLLFVFTASATSLLAISLLVLAAAAVSYSYVAGRKSCPKSAFLAKTISICFIPVIISAYIIGVASGVKDKLAGAPELKFEDW